MILKKDEDANGPFCLLLPKECLATSLNNDGKLSTLCWHTWDSGGPIVR